MSPYRNPPAETFERVANFRDMGGHRTNDGRRLKSGRLFRSGHLAKATDQDVAVLTRLGIRRVFDFRNGNDITAEGMDRLPEGTEHIRLPMPDPAQGHDIREMITGNRDKIVELFGDGRAEKLMVLEAGHIVRKRTEPYREFMHGLCSPAAFPALFHCSAGKDRAGWAGSVVLLTLGVPEEEVIEQYLLSNRASRQLLEHASEAERGPWSDALLPLLEVRAEYIQASFDAVRQDWGDFETYLREGLSVSADQQRALRDELLE